jgi:hypothetical protein
MIIRKVDDNNDWHFGKGLNDYAFDEAAIQQNVRSRILSWFGDCFFALQDGVDWKARLDKGQKDALRADLKAALLQSFGVVAVNEIDVEFTGDTRILVVKYDIQTIFSASFQSIIQQAAGVGS